jgi:hypothetical protein
MTFEITTIGVGVAVVIKCTGYAVAMRRVPMSWRKALLWTIVRTGVGLGLAVLAWRGLLQLGGTGLFSSLSEPWDAVCAWSILLATFAGVRFAHWFGILSYLRGGMNAAIARYSAFAVVWSFALDVVVVAAVWLLPWATEIRSMSATFPRE